MERILVIQTAFIGDAVLTLPMLEKLKDMNPGCAVDVVSIPATAEIFESSPHADDVFVLDKRSAHKSIPATLKFAESLRARNYGKVYSPHRSFRSSLIVKKINPPESYGFSNSSYKRAYKTVIEYNPAAHEVRRNLDLIGWKYSDSGWQVLPHLKVPENAVKKMDNFFVNYGPDEKIIAVAPGSVWQTKRYPEKYFSEIIGRLLEWNYTLVLIGGQSDSEICGRLATEFDGRKVYSAAGEFSLVESVEFLKRTELLICNDSAPTHLGMCADIPVVTIYCSTVTGFGFAPYNSKSTVISYDDLYCKPCGIHGYNKCPVGTFECGNNLKPEIILSKIEEILDDKS